MIFRDALEKSGNLRPAFLLGSMTLFCFTLSVFRFVVTGHSLFLFLNWNLFLAFIPWAISILISQQKKPGAITIVVLPGLWLLFFPNAPYILTDLFHLRIRPAVPVWFDLILILSFAWTGLAFGFHSLQNIEDFLRKFLRPWLCTAFLILMMFVGSFGVYVGRYLRWNSWDIVQEPGSLLTDIGMRLLNPTAHVSTWGLTILLGVLLNLMYWTFRSFNARSIRLQR